MEQCSKCGGERQIRYLINGHCAKCSKGISRTTAGVPNPGLLTAEALDRLPLGKHEIGPNDSLSVIGEKRMQEL